MDNLLNNLGTDSNFDAISNWSYNEFNSHIPIPEIDTWKSQIDTSEPMTRSSDAGNVDFLAQLESLERRTAQQTEKLRRQRAENQELNKIITRKELETQLKHVRICELKAAISELEHALSLQDLAKKQHISLKHLGRTARSNFSSTQHVQPVQSMLAAELHETSPSMNSDVKARLTELRSKTEVAELTASRLSALRTSVQKSHNEFQAQLTRIKNSHPLQAKVAMAESEAEEWEKRRDTVDPTGAVLRQCTLGLTCDAPKSNPEIAELDRKLFELKVTQSSLQSQVDRANARLEIQIRDRMVATSKLNHDKEASNQKLRERARFLERLQKQQGSLEAKLRTLSGRDKV